MSTDDQFDFTHILKRIAEDFVQVYFIYHPENNKLIYVHPSFRKIWEINEESVLQNPGLLLTYIHTEDLKFVQEQYYKLMQDEVPKQVDFRIIDAFQNNKWITVSAAVYRLEENKDIFIAGFAYDITKTKEYLNNTLNFNAKKNATLEILSHDLATPFTNIQGVITMMEEQVQEGNMEIGQMIAYIKEDAKRGSDLIRDFVGNEFLESSQITLYKERFDIKIKIQAMMVDYNRGESLVAKQFIFNAPQEPVYVELDQMKFMQVLNNLISNAIKFTHDDGIITITLEDRGESTFFSVQDNGIGIPSEMQPTLFDKFTKARREGLRGEKSVGLGMNIIKNLVKIHGGKIWFKSKEGEGSTFYIEIPK